MNILSKALMSVGSALALTASSIIPAEAMSENFRHHYNLAVAAEEVGIDFLLNPPACFTKKNRNTYGWYYAAGKQLVVCQVNAKNSQEVEWTEEDLDTLRHEIHHMVQDCRDNQLDGELHAIYSDIPALSKNVLGYEMIGQILKAYSDLPPHSVMMELEAFSVAQMNDPQEQLRDIQNYCM